MQSVQQRLQSCPAATSRHAGVRANARAVRAVPRREAAVPRGQARDDVAVASSWHQTQQRAVSLVSAAVLSATLLVQPVMAQEVDDSVTKNAVEEYSRLEASGKFSSKTGAAAPKALEDFRNKYRLRRMADGRLQLRSSKGEWFQCRLDMEVPGSMLLRDPKGNVYAIQTEALQQIDLSDDLVALMMFADGDWEKQMSAMEYIDDKGKVKQLQLEDKDFREVVGLLSGLEDADEAAPSSRK